MAFSWGRNESRVMSFVVLRGRPSISAPRKKKASFVPMGAVCTGKVCSTHW
jgi:hypothetical protein